MRPAQKKSWKKHRGVEQLVARRAHIRLRRTKVQGKKKFFYKEEQIHRGVEQLVARRAHNPKVVGSSPAPATTRHREIDAFFIIPVYIG